MAPLNHTQEENQELRKEVKELKSSVGELTAVVQTLRSDRPSRDTPILNHTHLSKLESLAKAESEHATVVQHLKRELMNVQGEVEGLKKRARHSLADVQADGPSSLQKVGETDYLSSLQSRDAMSFRSAGQFKVHTDLKTFSPKFLRVNNSCAQFRVCSY